MTEYEEQRCIGCGAASSDTGLFFTPGGWPGDGQPTDGTQGLCANCGAHDARYRERFARRFGVVQYITDSDSVTAVENSGRA